MLKYQPIQRNIKKMNVQDSLKIFAYDSIISELYSLREMYIDMYSDIAENEPDENTQNMLCIVISDLNTLINKYEIDPMTTN